MHNKEMLIALLPRKAALVMLQKEGRLRAGIITTRNGETQALKWTGEKLILDVVKVSTELQNKFRGE